MLTKGWDTVSLIRQEKINEELLKSWSGVNSAFNYSIGENTGEVKGHFAPWQVVNGGGGRLLRMEFPISDGEMVMNGASYDISGLTAVVDLTLTLIPDPETTDKSILKNQYAHFTKDESEIPDDNEGWIHPVTLIGDTSKLGAYAEVVLDSICYYLLANPNQIIFTFAEISLAKTGCPDWLRPQSVKYAYLDTGYLCILAVCDDRGTAGLPLDVDVSGLASISDSYFIISPKLLLTNVILPCVCELYDDASLSDFTITETGFYNNCELDMEEIKSGAIYYTPVVYSGKNIGAIEGSYIRIDYKGYCDMYAGITMYWNGYVKMEVSLADDGTIYFKKIDDDFDHDEDIPWYLKWLSLVVMAITEIVVAIISDDLIDKIADQGASISADGINTVEWFGETEKVNNAYLNESLILQYN
ncbi:MAG TPA: hypothetical protein DHV96_03850 [Lachnospiraceae bacterium]|nr:hypothetical protein [Lachnospiraceae bacterium]